MILVTGGTGFIGAHLLFRLCARGEKVRALKRRESSTTLTQKIFSYYSTKADDVFSKIEWVDGDLLDIFSLAKAMQDVDTIYHAAAVVSFHGKDQMDLITTNREGTANMVNVALELKIKMFCHVSTIGSLGRANQGKAVDEETHWNNKKTSVYSTSKYEAEREVWRGIAEGLKAVIVNPSIVIGPGNWDSGSPKLFQTMWDGLRFYTSGSNGFVDVNDVVESMIALSEAGISGERYIINSENISYKQFFAWMAQALGVKPPAYHAGPFLSGLTWRILAIKSLFTGKKSSITRETAETANQKYRYSNAKVCDAIGISFLPVKESLEQTAKYFLQEHTNL